MTFLSERLSIKNYKNQFLVLINQFCNFEKRVLAFKKKRFCNFENWFWILKASFWFQKTGFAISKTGFWILKTSFGMIDYFISDKIMFEL